MSMTAQFRSYNAKQLDPSKRKQLGLDAISNHEPVSKLAESNNVSRKFVYQQRSKAINAVNNVFEPANEINEKVLFYMPVTFSWLCQLIICLITLLFVDCHVATLPNR